MPNGVKHSPLIHISLGGPEYQISVNGKIHTFEWHHYCGPNVLGKRGDPLANQPVDFLKAAGLWDEQGRRMGDELCRWDHPKEPILKHLGGRHYKVMGFQEPVKGN